MRRLGDPLALAFLAVAAVAENPPLPQPPYGQAPFYVPNWSGLPRNRPPAPPLHPPEWYYNPYTQGIVPLPQRGGN